MMPLEAIEAERRAEQTRLDQAMGLEERNRMGQFATPNLLARDIVRFVKTLLPRGKPVRFLEPSIGTGSFYSALLHELPRDRVKSVLGFEVNEDFVTVANKLWKGTALDVRLGDFTQQPVPEKKFNLVVANPPYVRHHHLDREQKERLGRRLDGVKLSGLAGLYCYFMLLTHDWLEDGAVSAWLVPSEFMDVNYGKAIREYLTERVRLLRIHRFCPTDGQFAEALVSSAVVVFEKARPADAVTFSFGGTVVAPQHEAKVPVSTLKKATKWTRFNDPARDHGMPRRSGPVFGDYFAIKRGLATGNNDYFIMTREKAKELELPEPFLRPILPSPRNLRTDVVAADRRGFPNVDPQLVVLDCPLDLHKVAKQYPRLMAYLEIGVEQKVNEGYLASRRAPWHSQEHRPAAPFLCTYMGRSQNGRKPFRFIWNQSKATAHTVDLLLYPKGELKAVIETKPELAGKVFEALNSIDTDSFRGEGRVYGGGLFKMEPKELSNIPAEFLTKIVKIPAASLFDNVAEAV